MPKLYQYFVTGPFTFPSDMLRYDQAHVVCEGTVGDFTGYIIEGKVPPTRGRWLSFMWQVFPVNRVDLAPSGHAWEVKLGSMWEVLELIESDEPLPTYLQP